LTAPRTEPPPVLSAGDPRTLEVAAEALGTGKVVAIPTDTVYGLGASIGHPEAMAAVFRAKGRPPGFALPVVVGRWRQAREVAAQWPKPASQLAARFWPGALTVVVPVDPQLGRHLGGNGATVGLREPDHRFVRALCRLAGPIALTSANRHAEPPCTTAEAVLAAFGEGDVALVVDGGTCDGAPSTVADCTVSPPVCLRAGAIDWSWVEASLR
jgi:L-threonylcarbamoyladenylate synthase